MDAHVARLERVSEGYRGHQRERPCGSRVMRSVLRVFSFSSHGNVRVVVRGHASVQRFNWRREPSSDWCSRATAQNTCMRKAVTVATVVGVVTYSLVRTSGQFGRIGAKLRLVADQARSDSSSGRRPSEPLTRCHSAVTGELDHVRSLSGESCRCESSLCSAASAPPLPSA